MSEDNNKADLRWLIPWLLPGTLQVIWFYLQLQVWKQEGHDPLLIALNSIVTVLLWGSLGWMMYRAHRRGRDAHQLAEKAFLWAQEAKRAGGQAALLFHLAACAEDLRERLEHAEFSWREAGDLLVYPLDVSKNKYKEWGHHINEHRDFMAVYTQHKVRLSVDLPGFTSRMLAHGYPSDCKYPVFLADLKDHIQMLDKLGKRVWKEEEEMKDLNVKSS